MKKPPVFHIIFTFFLAICIDVFPVKTADAETKNVKRSSETEACIDCHRQYTPGIVEDWLSSRHATVSPGEVRGKPMLQRRVSSDSIPEMLAGVTVGCYECHGLNPSPGRGTFEHFDFAINSIVTPTDCKTCHALEAEEYGKSKKAHALGILDKNPVYSSLVKTVTTTKGPKAGRLVSKGSSENARNETCYACHGTEVKVKGMRTVKTDQGDIKVPDLTNFPNHGVGRVNPDGSLGACSACHPRHSFSIEIARKPYTCAQCHLEPDTPAWNVYKESKHGNIFFSREGKGNFQNVPWVAGKDFQVPTCASCHNSLVTTPDGEVVKKRNHDFGSSLWVRIFGLIYSHPQPKDGRTYLIKNGDGLPLPTTFLGQAASDFLIDEKEQSQRQGAMKRFCISCHATSHTDKFFEKFDTTNREADAMVKASTHVLLDAWKKKIADKSNPFDETIEQKWVRQWLFYGNSVRYGSAMSGPDYTTFKNGWWNMMETIGEMESLLKAKGKGNSK